MMEKRPDSDGDVAETGDEPPPSTVAERWAATADGGAGIERMLDAKLWDNPCWLAFRLNYLALRYNTPLYDWVQRTRGLSRVEYVVIYSLALTDGGQARDISETSGFPKNTLSRAIARLEELGLIVREHLPGGGRNQPLRLSGDGWQLFEETLPAFERFERMMLSALSPDEQKTLSDLLAKVVRAGDDWPETLTDPERDLPDPRDTEAEARE
jgi:DNA-binding MarR family transcriptional regulator